MNRDLARWILEFIKTLLVLGARKYFADRTGSTYIIILYWVALFALSFYFFSFWQEWDIRLFELMSFKRIGSVIDLILNVALGLVFFGLNYVLTTVTNEIAQAQVK